MYTVILNIVNFQLQYYVQHVYTWSVYGERSAVEQVLVQASALEAFLVVQRYLVMEDSDDREKFKKYSRQENIIMFVIVIILLSKCLSSLQLYVVLS